VKIKSVDTHVLYVYRVTQALEDLPRLKKPRIQFTIEKPELEAEEVCILRFIETSALSLIYLSM
jgi:hypothetical protein